MNFKDTLKYWSDNDRNHWGSSINFVGQKERKSTILTGKQTLLLLSAIFVRSKISFKSIWKKVDLSLHQLYDFVDIIN